jgi:hypothetical protein
MEQLGDDHVGQGRVELPAEEDDPMGEEPRVDVVGTLAAGGLLDHGGYQGRHHQLLALD